VWWDWHIPAGKTFRQVIQSALDGARCIVVLWSAKSIGRKWVLEEAGEAEERGVLVPALIEYVRPPLGFRSIQAADLITWNGDTAAPEFHRLCADIEALIGQPADARSATAPPDRQAARASGDEAPKLPDDESHPPHDRPRICITAWSSIPDAHPVPVRVGQSGFTLVNDGSAAYDITVEPFTIFPGRTGRGETVSRIAASAEEFALAWQDDRSPSPIATGKWDLLGAMQAAAGAPSVLGGPDYTIMISVTYRDADGAWWYRSTTPLSYIRSQHRLAAGTPKHETYARTKAGLEVHRNAPVLTFLAWHGASELGHPRMVDEDHVPSFIRVKNTQTAIPVTAQRVVAHLRYRNAAGTTDSTVEHAPWYITTGPTDPQAHWADTTTLEASATASFALFLTDKNSELWVYQEGGRPSQTEVVEDQADTVHRCTVPVLPRGGLNPCQPLVVG